MSHPPTKTNQIQTEKKTVEETQEKYDARVTKATEEEHESDTPAGTQLLGGIVPFYAEAIEGWLTKAATGPGRTHSAVDCLALLADRPLLISTVAARTIIDGISKQRTLTSLALQVGTAIEQEHRLELAAHLYPGLTQSIIANAHEGRSEKRLSNWVFKGIETIKGDAIPRLPKTTRLRSGLVLIELFRKSTGLIYVNKKKSGRRTTATVLPSDDLMEWLDEAHENLSVLRPMFRPMIIPPLKWGKGKSGGYITAPVRLVKRTRDHRTYKNMEAPHVYDALNKHQETAWRVNKPILDLMLQCWNSGYPIGGMPSRELSPWPNKPGDIDTNPEAKLRYSRDRAYIRSRRVAEKSQRLSFGQLISIATEFFKPNDEGELNAIRCFFPASLDFRGRMYSVPRVLNPQGNQFAKALLEFNKGHKVGEGADFLRIHGANLWGLSGETNEAKINWTKQTEKIIKKTCEDPFADNWWTGADKPWLFLAWVLDYGAYLTNPETHKSHLPVSIDGSNNGCQMWAGVLRDEDTAKRTNLAPTDEPADLYQEVADSLKISDEHMASWQSIGITRSLIKRAVMTIPYSATLSGLIGTLLPHIDKAKFEGKEIDWSSDIKGAAGLAKSIVTRTWELMPCLKDGMDWLKEVADIAATHGVPVTWTTPTGFPVSNDYREPDRTKVQTRMGRTYRVNTLAEPSHRMNKRKAKTAIAANFIHSIDAAILHITIAESFKRGVSSFSMVHDSFGSHAKSLPIVAEELRKAAVRVFEHDLLGELKASTESSLPDGVVLPDPPERGDFDINTIINATYFAS